MGHVRMMAAVQPFISGRDLEDHQHAGGVHGGRHHGRLHRELAAGPEGGGDLPRRLEARAAAQFGTGKGEKKAPKAVAAPRQVREKIVYRRSAASCPTSAVGHAQVLHRRPRRLHHGGLYEDGTPGEIFITMAKEGSTISGLMDSFATAVSYGCSTACR
jgi:ribonucleoside-diphosphate reductase alpha chain